MITMVRNSSAPNRRRTTVTRMRWLVDSVATEQQHHTFWPLIFPFLFFINIFLLTPHSVELCVCECNLCPGPEWRDADGQDDGVGKFVSLRLLLINERKRVLRISFSVCSRLKLSYRSDVHQTTFKFHFKGFSAVWVQLCLLCSISDAHPEGSIDNISMRELYFKWIVHRFVLNGLPRPMSKHSNWV